jgi:hypothetical protein
MIPAIIAILALCCFLIPYFAQPHSLIGFITVPLGLALSVWLFFRLVWRTKRRRPTPTQRQQTAASTLRAGKPPATPTPAAVRMLVEQRYGKRVAKPLEAGHLRQILDVQQQIFAKAKFSQLSAREATEAVEMLVSGFVDGLVAYTSRVPPHLLEMPRKTATFSIAVPHTMGQWEETKGELKFRFAPGGFDAFQSLAKPFQVHKTHLSSIVEYGNIKWYQTRSSDDYESQADYNRASARVDKANDELLSFHDSYQIAMMDSPYWSDALRLLPTGSRLEPFEIPEETYFKSTFIVAPPGRGKTTLLRALFYDRLELVKKNKASIIILDSKGQFADEIAHLKVFAKGQPLHDKLILINPDPDFPLALNPLQLDPPPVDATEGQKGLAQSRTIELIEYLISVFVPGDQSNPQQRFLRAVIKALLEVFPDPTFEDLYQLLVRGYEPFEDKISNMQDRSFFSKDQFYGGTVKPTRESLITRIGFMRDNYALASIIKSRESRLNLADAMDSGKVVIVNNGIDLLGDEGCEFFGRFFLYLMRKAAERRRPIPEDKKMPVYVMCDEAHNVIKRDDKISRTIQDLRSHKIAMTFAIQDLSEIHSEKVKSALFSCGIIFANTKEDAPALVTRLRVKDPNPLDFINRTVPGEFAAYVFGKADDAVALSVTPPLEQPAMTDDEFAEVIDLMHERYCVGTPKAVPTAPQLVAESSKKRGW